MILVCAFMFDINIRYVYKNPLTESYTYRLSQYYYTEKGRPNYKTRVPNRTTTKKKRTKLKDFTILSIIQRLWTDFGWSVGVRTDNSCAIKRKQI